MQTTSVQDQISSAIVDGINVARLQDKITQETHKKKTRANINSPVSAQSSRNARSQA